MKSVAVRVEIVDHWRRLVEDSMEYACPGTDSQLIFQVPAQPAIESILNGCVYGFLKDVKTGK